MKNLKFLFLSLFMVAFLAPNLVNAQAVDLYSLNPNQCTIGLVTAYNSSLVGSDIVLCESADLMITPDGTLHLKATFDVNGSNFGPIPTKGKKKLDIVRVAFWWTTSGETLTQIFETHGTIDSDGYVKVVCNVDPMDFN